MSRIRFSLGCALICALAWAACARAEWLDVARFFILSWLGTLGGITLVDALRRLTRSS